MFRQSNFNTLAGGFILDEGNKKFVGERCSNVWKRCPFNSILSVEVLRGHNQFDWDRFFCLNISLVNNPEIPGEMGDLGVLFINLSPY